MRTIVHVSDLHFGRIDYNLAKPLAAVIRGLSPDLVVVSGDLTQRARAHQFNEARAFLSTLPQPQLVVPGNHDVPLYNVAARVANPFANYRRYISENLEPFYADEEIAAVGLNTARSLTIKRGRVNSGQIRRVVERLCRLERRVTKIIVTHHPFDLPESYPRDQVVGRARKAMQLLARCGADIWLSGHLHVGHAAHTWGYWIVGQSALIVQAGTAISTRGRGEPNSFNVIRIAHPVIEVHAYSWVPERSEFTASAPRRFRRTNHGWQPEILSSRPLELGDPTPS